MVGDATVRSLPVLVAPSSEVALPGQTKYYQWTNNDDVRLFQRAVDRNEGIFGLGYVIEQDGKDALFEKIVLMEIEDYNMMGQDFGIFCSAKVVGRASLLHTQVNGDADQEPLTGFCNELFDRRETIGLEEANSLARSIIELVAEVSNAEKRVSMIEDIDDLADQEETRIDRFWAAYEAALGADNQGYHVPAGKGSEAASLSWKEINAISWAAFATNACLKRDETYRISALNIELISNRLQLANFWLADVLIQTLV